MKKFLLLGLVALFMLVSVSVYAYSNQSNNSFDWMPRFSMHERHHEQMDEWIDEALQKGEISEEEAAWYREHFEEMDDFAISRRYRCH